MRLPFHHQAADELGGNLLGAAGKEALGEGLGERGGMGVAWGKDADACLLPTQ